MHEITWHIPQISCGHCISTIKNEIAEIGGAEFVSGDPLAKTVVINYDTEDTLDKVKAMLVEIGFFPVD